MNARPLGSLAILFACLTTLPAQAQDPSSTPPVEPDLEYVRRYDLRSLATATEPTEPGVDMRLHLSSSYLDTLEPDAWDVNLESAYESTPDTIAELVLQALGDSWSDGNWSVESDNGFLRVEGGDRTHTAVGLLLEQIHAQVLATVRLEVYQLDAQSIPPDVSSRLDASEAQALIDSQSGSLVAVQRSRLGQRIQVGRESIATRLYDYDVEVAQFAQVADAAVTVLRSGHHLGAVVLPEPGGGYFLRLWGRVGELQPEPESPKLGHLGDSPLGLSAQNTRLAIGSGSISEGGALLLGQSGAGSGAWLVRVKGDGQPAATAKPAMPRLIPLGELAAQALMRPSPWLSRANPSGGWSQQSETLTRRIANRDYSFFEAPELVSLLWDLRDSEQLSGTPTLLGTSLWIHGSEAFADRAEAWVRSRREASGCGSTRMEVRYDIVETGAASQLLNLASAADIARQLPKSLFSVGRFGDSVLLVDGSERFYLKDIDVEIAQGAAIGDPIVGHTFQGVSVWTRTVPAPGGRLNSWVELQYQEDGPTSLSPVVHWEPVVTTNPKLGQTPTGSFQLKSAIELPSTQRAGLLTMLTQESGQWGLVGASQVSGTTRMLVAVARFQAD